MNEENNRFMKIQDVCTYFSISDETVYRWIKTKKFPAHRIGKQWFFRLEEIEAWVANQEKSERK